MAQKTLTFFAVLIALLAGVYQLHVKPLLVNFGVGRVIGSIGNHDCTTIPELQACEKIVLHQPTGVIYLACSIPSSRSHWTPAVSRLNATGRSENDYVAVYNPATSKIKRLKVLNYRSPRGLSLHGMDVVPSSSDPAQLFVYLVNHRKPLGGEDAQKVGADSSIEIFKASVGGDTLTHLNTVEDPVVLTPNDVVGSPDGKSFYFTNDYGSKTSYTRQLDIYFGRASSSVGFCHLDEGCKIAISAMQGNNGIARANNDTFYVANALRGGVSVLERQSDNTLMLTDIAPSDRPIDNLSVDDDGVVWAAGLSELLTLVLGHFSNNSIPAASAAIRISRNTGPTALHGEKFKVENVFEDNGTIASGITSVVHDSQRGLLFMHGLCSPHFAICKI